MKLENVPVPLTVEIIDEYMTPIFEAVTVGDISLIKNVLLGIGQLITFLDEITFFYEMFF